jgi:hypothetical protein
MKIMKRKILIFIMPMLLFGLVFMNSSTPVSAAGTLTGVSSARVGVTYTVTAEGLTSTTIYLVVAAHSGGNLTEVISGASSSTVAFTFSSEDADGVVPIQLWQSNATLGLTAAADDTLLVNLDAADQGLSTAFFVGILGGLLVIVIIVRVVRNLINST